MNKFVSLPLDKLMNRENPISRIERLESRVIYPSIRVGNLAEISNNLGEQVAGSYMIVDPVTGAGIVVLNASGIAIEATTNPADVRSYKFVDSGGDIIGGLYASATATNGTVYLDTGNTTKKNTLAGINAYTPSTAADAVAAVLLAAESEGNPSVKLSLVSNASGGVITLNESGADVDTVILDDASAEALKVDAAAHTVTVYGTTLPGTGGAAVNNAIINGECLVAQAFDATLSTTATFGKLDRFAAWGTGTAVSAGTITQDAASTIGQGYALHVSGATLTGTGIVYIRHRIEAKDAIRFKNQSASFACKVLHDVGSAKNYTITIRKANALDDFSGVTDIGNSGALSVDSATGTTIKYENVSMGDCSNGIEIEVKCECGAVTTKNFRYAEFILDIGSTAPTFQYRDTADILAKCLRYRFVPNQDAEPIIWPAYAARVSTNVVDAIQMFPIPMFKTPTLRQAAGIAWGTSYPLGSGKIGFYDNVAAGYATITGALTLSFANGCATGGIFRAAAGTSFSGTSGSLGNFYLGTNLKIAFEAEP